MGVAREQWVDGEWGDEGSREQGACFCVCFCNYVCFSLLKSPNTLVHTHVSRPPPPPQNARCFLPKKRAPAQPLVQGSLLDVTVEAVNKTSKLVTVAAAAGDEAPAVTRDWDGLSISTLLPGAVVPCKYVGGCVMHVCVCV